VSLFGSGGYKFVVRDSCGAIVLTIDNIGVAQTGENVPSAETPAMTTGGSDNQVNGDSVLIVYDENGTVIGSASVLGVWVAGASAAASILGGYSEVQTVFSLGGQEIPEGSIIVGDPQDGYDNESTRLYQITASGSSSINPASDSNVNQLGKGDNYTDLMRLAASEEMRVKRVVGQWENVNEVVSSGTLEYPIVVIGSDGEFYKTTGSPTAAAILGTDPVSDTTSTVWVPVYDPQNTAQYPPAYRSALTGVNYNNSLSIKIPIQYHKLRTTVDGWTNDGAPDEIYYKSVDPWERGAGTSGSPVGGLYDVVVPTFWANVYMVKTSGGEIDYITALSALADPDDILAWMNGLAAEIAAARTWVAWRRIATVECPGGTGFTQFNRSANEYILRQSTVVLTISSGGNGNYTPVLWAPPYALARFSVSVTGVAHADATSTPYLQIYGYDEVAGGYDMMSFASVEHDVNYRSAGGAEYVRRVNGSSIVTVAVSSNALHEFQVKSTSYIDALDD
jgi:hypothetical protein